MPSRFCSFYFVNVHTHIVVCVCVYRKCPRYIPTAFGRHAAENRRRSLPLSYVLVVLWVVTYIFGCIFPFDCCAKTEEEEEEKGGERNFSGVAVWWCCGFALTHVSSSPNSSLHHPSGRKERQKNTCRNYTLLPNTFQRIFIFHFLTTVTHTNKQVTLATIGRPDSSETRNNFWIFFPTASKLNEKQYVG